MTRYHFVVVIAWLCLLSCTLDVHLGPRAGDNGSNNPVDAAPQCNGQSGQDCPPAPCDTQSDPNCPADQCNGQNDGNCPPACDTQGDPNCPPDQCNGQGDGNCPPACDPQTAPDCPCNPQSDPNCQPMRRATIESAFFVEADRSGADRPHIR
ncbi:MAG: hypothetical protein MJE77_23555 [Proteobacteria bacterium]|nr:hypothetical protein [Pseudomonadota bacterium]